MKEEANVDASGIGNGFKNGALKACDEVSGKKAEGITVTRGIKMRR